jgi:hypothetical protein
MLLRQVATRFLVTHDLRLPLRADVALYAAGFWPLPSDGPASQNGDILRYDETRQTWEREVWSLVCARLLQRDGFEPTLELCAELAAWFGVVLEGSCLHAVSR